MTESTAPRKVLLGFVGVNLVAGAVSLLDEGVTPSWVVYPLLLLIGAVLLVRRPGRIGIVFLGASALLFLLVHIPFTVEALSPGPCVNPADPDFECSPVLWPFTLTAIPLITLLAAGWAWFRERDATPAATRRSGRRSSTGEPG